MKTQVYRCLLFGGVSGLNVSDEAFVFWCVVSQEIRVTFEESWLVSFEGSGPTMFVSSCAAQA